MTADEPVTVTDIYCNCGIIHSFAGPKDHYLGAKGTVAALQGPADNWLQKQAKAVQEEAAAMNPNVRATIEAEFSAPHVPAHISDLAVQVLRDGLRQMRSGIMPDNLQLTGMEAVVENVLSKRFSQSDVPAQAEAGLGALIQRLEICNQYDGLTYRKKACEDLEPHISEMLDALHALRLHRKNLVITTKEISEINVLLKAALTQPLDIDALKGWMPIESAPRDGTEILVFYPVTMNTAVPGWVVPASYKEWAWFRSGTDLFLTGEHSPTHWQHLPAPPKDGADNE